jgi:hypothetical protein
LFAILTLLGAIAVLVTGILGYVRARDALEQAIYNQLTAAREIKARQVETYFRTIHAELRLLATSKMVVEAAREFRVAFGELDREPLSDEMRGKVSDWYGAHFVPEISRVLGTAPVLADYLPVGSGASYLQYHYIVANPHTEARRRWSMFRRRQPLQQAARHLSSPHACRRRDRRLRRLHDCRPEVRTPDLHGRQGCGLRHIGPHRSLPEDQHGRCCRPLFRDGRPVRCLPGGL